MSTSPIHALRAAEVFTSLETSIEGLSSEEASSRRSLYGENLLSEQKRENPGLRLLDHFKHPLTGLLFAAGLLALIEDWVLTAVIWLLTFANTGFSLWREYRAEKAVEKLQEVLPAYAHTLRDGKDVYIPARDIVPGDILILEEGDNIPADARVVEEYGLRTNNATLTGESIPARKNADPSYLDEVSELERPNLIFAGTSVAAGTGKAVVYATGMLTQFGRIAHLTQIVNDEPSMFQKELTKIVKVSSFIAIGLGVLVIVIGLTEGETLKMDIRELLFFALGIIIACIPEGLPATLTLALAMAVQRLAGKNVLVKKLNTVETLGNISVICTDKSGTLTQNQMTVREIWVSRQRIKVSGVGYEPKGNFAPDPEKQDWDEDMSSLLEAAFCCNNARINPPNPEHPTWTSLGDQTEAAMKVAAMKGGIKQKNLELLFPRVHEIPFDARRKRMTTIHHEYHSEIAFTKGAPREVLQLCTHIKMNNQVVPLTNEIRAEIMAANDDYARSALRVLALATRLLPTHRTNAYTSETVERELTFLGLMAMMDPPRPEVEEAIHTCREAGIRIVMITGDYGLTAESLARRVGMISTKSPRIVTGAEVDELSDIELQNIVQNEVIFARMAPEHKLRLVSIFQALGHVVAVTGDGVNDAPALRKADVGVAMGIVGTDVAKEAADIILTSDNFGAIVSAIEEGRAVYDNVRKFITYIFSSNVPELMPFIISASIPGFPLALGVRQILAIDLGTDFLPALALGMEKPEPGVMKKKPRPRNQPLLDNKLIGRALWLGSIEAILCFIGFLAVYRFSSNTHLLPIHDWLSQVPMLPIFYYPIHDPSMVLILAVTVYHAGVVMAQIGNAFACRSESNQNRQLGWVNNKYLNFAIIAEIMGILLMVYFPPLAAAFEHQPIPAQFWLGLALFWLILYSLEWIRKQIWRVRAPANANNAV